MIQRTFCPVDYGWTWTEDWYEWDREAGHKAARKARNASARGLRNLGYSVVSRTLRHQRITRGGIGSGYPQIEQVVSVYMLQVL